MSGESTFYCPACESAFQAGGTNSKSPCPKRNAPCAAAAFDEDDPAWTGLGMETCRPEPEFGGEESNNP